VVHEHGIPVDLGVMQAVLIMLLAFASVFFAIWSTCSYSDRREGENVSYLRAQLIAALLWIVFAAADVGAVIAIIAWRG